MTYLKIQDLLTVSIWCQCYLLIHDSYFALCVIKRFFNPICGEVENVYMLSGCGGQNHNLLNPENHCGGGVKRPFLGSLG